MAFIFSIVIPVLIFFVVLYLWYLVIRFGLQVFHISTVSQNQITKFIFATYLAAWFLGDSVSFLIAEVGLSTSIDYIVSFALTIIINFLFIQYILKIFGKQRLQFVFPDSVKIGFCMLGWFPQFK